MPLEDLNLPIRRLAVPGNVRSFLREAHRRIDQFQRTHHIPGFVPGDFTRAYAVWHTLAAADLASGNLVCEWGSGFGVVACLAAMLDFEACGIEIESNLVDAARQLAEDYALPVEFVCGSFIPRGCEAHLVGDNCFAWLTTDEDNPLEELGLAPDDFGIICAYPWPDEEQLTEDLFERCAAPEALLLTFHEGENFRLRRKIS